MTCDVSGFTCENKVYKTLHLCPVKRGDTFPPPLKIEAFVIKDGNRTPMDIDEAIFKVFKYGKESFTLPTNVNSGVITINSVKGETTKEWSKLVYTYELTLVMSSGRVISYLSGNFPVI